MEAGKIIAFNLQKLRKERNLSIGRLAKLSGISKGMLSNIESGNSNPTINTIWSIANSLKVPYTKLMELEQPEAAVVRKDEATVQTGDTQHYRVHCYFTTSPSRNFELFYVELDAGTSNESIGHSEKSQEYLYVIEGVLELHTETADYRLEAGDSLMFDSSLEHTYFNNQESLLKLMVINYYPN